MGHQHKSAAVRREKQGIKTEGGRCWVKGRHFQGWEEKGREKMTNEQSLKRGGGG